MNKIIYIAGALMAGVACGGGTTRNLEPTPTPVHNDCIGGFHRGLEADLAPSRIDGRRVELRLDLASHLEGAARSRWAVEVVDDTGRPAAKPSLATPVSLAGHGAKHSTTISTPADLADGFYVIRVTAVAKTATASETAVLERYLEVRHGEATPIDSDGYHVRSRAMEGGVL